MARVSTKTEMESLSPGLKSGFYADSSTIANLGKHLEWPGPSDDMRQHLYSRSIEISQFLVVNGKPRHGYPTQSESTELP